MPFRRRRDLGASLSHYRARQPPKGGAQEVKWGGKYGMHYAEECVINNRTPNDESGESWHFKGAYLPAHGTQAGAVGYTNGDTVAIIPGACPGL